MRVAITIDGPSKKTLHWIENFSENTRQAIRQTFFRLGRDLKSKTNKDILDKASKTGHWYRVRSRLSGRMRWHRASAPLQTHANLTGDLRRSLGWQVTGTQYLDFGYGVSDRPTPRYAKDVEEGHPARDGSWVEPRPSLANNTKNIHFQSYFDEALRDLESK